MPLRYSTDTPAFDTDHRPVFSADYWDTVYTSTSAGVGFSLFTLLDPAAFESAVGLAPQAVAHATMESQLTSSNMESVLGYDGVDYVVGVTPNVYNYWGTGAPPGVAKSKATVLKYSGEVKDSGEVTLIFGGQGRVQVYVNQTEILNGEVYEPSATPSINTAQEFQDEAGYLMVAHTFTQGDELEIYYWHNGEPWGGIFCKGLPGDLVSGYDATTIRQQLRDAAVLGSSFFGIEAGGNSLSAVSLPYIETISIEKSRDSSAKAQITVPLTTSDQAEGFSWDPSNNTLVDNATSDVFKQDRRIRIYGGYASADTLKDAAGDITATTYPRLTGHITKIEPGEGMDVAIIHCTGYENLMAASFDENYPDRLSYLANGYINRSGSYEPVYNIPAFDNWPIEVALADLCYRSGMDAEVLGKAVFDADPNYGRMEIETRTTGEARFCRKLFAARYLANQDRLVKIERNNAYGNVGVLKKDYLPEDAPYLFKPEITDRLYDQATEIAEHYGYRLVFDAYGRAALQASENADEFIAPADGAYTGPQLSASYTNIDTTEPTTDIEISPEAVKGTYVEKLDSEGAWSIEVTGYFSRLDLYAGIGTDGTLNGGVVDVEIEVWNGSSWDPYDTTSVTTYRPLAGNETENLAFYYTGTLRDDGTNASVFQLAHMPFDNYRVTLTPGGLDPSDGGGDAAYRINGIAGYYLDSRANMFPVEFATDTNVFSMLPESGHEDLRNHVIVVGSRRGVVTDSAKFSGEQNNPNNREAEFHIEVASDPNSIYNPQSSNFTGNKRIAVIYDEKVSDSDFARWLALTALYRYRDPQHRVPVDTVAVPMLEIGDSIQVYEARHETVNRVVWVQSFRENWAANEASASIDTSSYPEIPAYQPREDLDVDGLFEGNPAINLEIAYKNLLGVAVDQTDLEAPDVRVPAGLTTETLTTLLGQTLSNPAMPETIALAATSGDTSIAKHRFLVNHPYRHFFRITGWTGDHRPTVLVDIQEGDGTSPVYNSTYYKMPGTAPYTWEIQYRTFYTRTGENPFYDPYTSEVGNLVSVKFDALVSGRYRVSIWDARKSGGLETPVAWLTNPQAASMDPDAHWVYMEPQNDVEFFWDGVDNIGIWNRQQSNRYAQRISGSFGEEAVAVAEGFYAWNDDSTEILTQVGDNVAANYRTTGDIREVDYPFFTVGKYGKFYVKIEVWNDELAAVDAVNASGQIIPRIVSSEDLNDSFNEVPETYIWTHLGEPSQVDISIQEWDPDKTAPGNPGEYSVGSTADGWVTLGSSDEATFRDGKPVRISFSPRPRPGVLFEEDANLTSALLTRQVHLQTTTFDQFWTFYNRPWEGIHYNNDVSVKEKRLTNRMYHNNDHSLEWVDSGFRSGAEIAAYKWIFQPSMFKKDFGKGYEEPLRYGDYQQLEALPGYNARSLGGAHTDEDAYINLAFMSYLFYFSAHSMDRSGRRQWMLNREFVDKSKIVTPDWLSADYASEPYYAVNHEDKGADLYLKRTIFAREWLDDDWTTGGARTPLSPVNANHEGTGGITDPFELEWVQFPISYLDLESAELSDPGSGSDHEDVDLRAYETDDSGVNVDVRKYLGLYDTLLLGDADGTGATLSGVASYYVLPHRFGNWNFIRGSQQIAEWHKPSPKADFHPYWNQFMPNWFTPHTNFFVADDITENFSYGLLPGWDSGGHLSRLTWMDLLKIPSSMIAKFARDPKGQENWFAYGFQHGVGGPEHRGFRVEQSVAGWAAEEARADLDMAFDYVRQDRLNRYEQFRGLWGRGPYEYRDNPYINYADYGKPKYGPGQSVKPSGVYFMNWGRYTDFLVGPAHSKHRQDYQHDTRGISDWFYLRYRHEYVWYHDRHFPVNGSGTSRYDKFREEYTRANDVIPLEWFMLSASPSISKLYYDAGAWVGWKDDIPLTGDTKWVDGWDTSPVLRWADSAYRGLGEVYQGTVKPWDPQGGTTGKEYSSGGFNHAANADQSTSYIDTQLTPSTPSIRYIKRNIFDHAEGNFGLFTLAVGPELDVSREIHMNLVLPTELIS